MFEKNSHQCQCVCNQKKMVFVINIHEMNAFCLFKKQNSQKWIKISS